MPHCRATARIARGRTARGDEVVHWSRRAVAAGWPMIRYGSRRRPCWGSDLGWQGNVPEGLAAYESVLARLSAEENGPPEDRVRMAYGWLRLVTDDVVGARTMLAQTAAARCGRARCGSRCGPSSGPHTRVSRWEPGTRRPRTPTERCPCWRKPDTNGYAHWRDARPCWSRAPAGNGPPPKNTPGSDRPTGRLRTHGGRRRPGPGTPRRRPQRSRRGAPGPGAGPAHHPPRRRRRTGILALARPLRRRTGQRGPADRSRRIPRTTRGPGSGPPRGSTVARLARVRGELEAAQGDTWQQQKQRSSTD